MNTTNADYFTFNVDNSLFIAGQTGSGKTFLVHKLVNALQNALSIEDIKFVFFDLKQVEFTDTDKNYLYSDVVTDPNTGLRKLEELARKSSERVNSVNKDSMLFVYIEECDMAVVDQSRFDKAVITINNNAKDANMKLIYSTSRPSKDVVSKKLLASFDLILAGKLASQVDANNLGVPYEKELEPYTFQVLQ